MNRWSIKMSSVTCSQLLGLIAVKYPVQKTNRMIKSYLILGFLFFYITSFTQDFDAELISQKTLIEINKGNLTKNLYYEIKINNRAGEKYTKITIPFSKLIRVSKIEAYVKDSNGREVKKLKKSDVVEKSSISDFSLYEDNFIKEFTLKHNVFPYTIVYSYQIQQNEFLNVDFWIPVIDEKIPTLNASLEVTIPTGYEIDYKNQLVDRPIIDTTENEIKFQWKASYTDIIKNEEYSPSILKFLPHVEITPVEFYYDINGSFKDWISFGNWQYEMLQGLSELPDYEKNKIQTLIKNIEDDKEKIKILYHYLQDETRYINVTTETGGLKPFPASYVAQSKFGDCKALTNYFKSMLDYIQIPSCYTKVYAGSPIKEIDKNFPSQQFNHVILYIPQKDEDIWLDCTSDGAFNYLGTFTQNRDAFVISKDNSRFVKTPNLKPSETLEIRKIETTLNSNSTNVKFTNTFKGDSYENILYLVKNYNDSEKSRIIRNHLVDDGFQLTDYKIFNPDRDSNRIKLVYDATTQNIYKQYGNDILVSNIAFYLPNLEKPQIRKLPVQIDYPIYKIDTIIYEIPKGYNLNQNAVAFSVNNRYGEYKLDVSKSSDYIITIKRVLIHTGYYPISEYEDFYNFYYQIIESENKTHIILSK